MSRHGTFDPPGAPLGTDLDVESPLRIVLALVAAVLVLHVLGLVAALARALIPILTLVVLALIVLWLLCRI